MAELLAENILGKIADQTQVHNDKLDKMIALQVQGKKESDAQYDDDSRISKAVTKYSQEQQGQETQYSKIAQHQQEKTTEELVRATQTDTPGLLSDTDVVTVQSKNEADEDDAQRDSQTSAEKRTAILEEMKEQGQNLLGRTVGGWVESGKQRLEEFRDFGKFKGALKADMDLMMGKFQLLTTLPGVQSLLQGLKFLFGTLVTFFVAGKFGNFFEPLIQKVEDALLLLGVKSKQSVDEARSARKALRETDPDKVVKSKAGDEYDVDSPQGKMIKNLSGAQQGLMASIKDGYKNLSNKAQKSFTDAGAWMGDVFKKNWTKTGKRTWEKGAWKYEKSFEEKWKDMGTSLKKIGDNLRDKFKNFSTSNTVFGRAYQWIGAGLKKVGKKMLGLMKKFFVQVAIFFMGIAMAIAGFIVANIIPIAIIAAIALLVIGIVWLVGYMIENWEKIKINFNEGWDLLKLKFSKDSIVNFFKTMVENIWLGIQQMAVNIRVGVENMVNSLIQKWNDFMPGSRFDMDPVDLGGKEAEAAMAKTRAQVESQQQERSDALAAQEKEIRDKYDEQRIAAGITPKNTVQQNNVTNTNQTKSYQASSTQPMDGFAAAMAASR